MWWYRIASVDPRVVRVAERIAKKLREKGVEVSVNQILLEALKFYEKFKFTPEEELVIELWDRIDRLEEEIEKLKSEFSKIRTRPAREEAKPVEGREDKFLDFIRDTLCYRLDRIKAPRTRIDKLIEGGYVEILESGGVQYLVYKPAMEELLESMPISLEEVKKMPVKTRRLIEVLMGAGLAYEDGIDKAIKRV